MNFETNTIWTEDNLKVMQGLNSNCIDLIYLDPPFNSNRNYSAPIGSTAAGAHFKDAWTLDDLDHEIHARLAADYPATHQVIDSGGYAHGDSMKSYLIYIAARLIQIERILKPNGSIYLHCDDTASAYLKLIMDCIFGKNKYMNTIIWKRASGKGGASKKFNRSADHILFYSGGTINEKQVLIKNFNDTTMGRYKFSDERGPYRLDDGTFIQKRRLRKDEVKLNGFDPSEIGMGWNIPSISGYAKFIDECIPGYLQADDETKLNLLQKNDFIHWNNNGRPVLKRYLNGNDGQVPIDIWDDIFMGSNNSERTGYPTQKPTALLERIIKASSNEGDVIFDPFCGTGTTLVAAHNLKRRWIGCDVSQKAVELAKRRIGQNDVIEAIEMPERTDLAPTDTAPRITQGEKKQLKLELFAEQHGRCPGCGDYPPFKYFELDHIVPRAKGGGDERDNLQMLCFPCNRSKGDKDYETWLREKGNDE